MRAPPSLPALLSLVSGLLAACQDPARDPLGTAGAGPGAHGPDERLHRDRGPDGQRVHRSDITRAAPALRLLNAHEYRNTVRDLLGVEASDTLDFADRGTGFDTGAGMRVDENLFSILFTESERLADAYVNGPTIRAALPCFDPANLTESCVLELLDTLGTRAHRRPLDDDTKSALLEAYRREVNEDDPIPLGECDPATQPEGHFGMREGRCRGSCGVLGGTNCPATSDTCAEGNR